MVLFHLNIILGSPLGYLCKVHNFEYIWSAQTSGETSILSIVGKIDGVNPKLWGKTQTMDHAISHLLQGMILPFRNNILMRYQVILWNNMLELNTLNVKTIFTSVVDIFTTIIYPQKFDRIFILLFKKGFEHKKSVEIMYLFL